MGFTSLSSTAVIKTQSRRSISSNAHTGWTWTLRLFAGHRMPTSEEVRHVDSDVGDTANQGYIVDPPLDITIRICSIINGMEDLTLRERKRTLLAISQTNRMFYYAAAPYLWSSVAILDPLNFGLLKRVDSLYTTSHPAVKYCRNLKIASVPGDYDELVGRAIRALPKLQSITWSTTTAAKCWQSTMKAISEVAGLRHLALQGDFTFTAASFPARAITSLSLVTGSRPFFLDLGCFPSLECLNVGAGRYQSNVGASIVFPATIWRHLRTLRLSGEIATAQSGILLFRIQESLEVRCQCTGKLRLLTSHNSLVRDKLHSPLLHGCQPSI